MTNFIEEFYYGNIDPQARSFEQNKKLHRDMQILTDNDDFLTDKLSGEEKKRFIQYVDAWAVVNGESTLDSFITGFRLGAQFTFDTFVTSKAPYGLSERRDITTLNDGLSALVETTIRLCHYGRVGFSVLSAKFRKKQVNNCCKSEYSLKIR